MKNLIIILALISTNNCSSQDMKDIVYISKDTLYYDGTNKGIIKQIFTTYSITAVPESFFNNSIHNAEIVMDIRSGYEINYYENGKIKSGGNIIYGCRIGIWLIYDKNGKLISKNYYKTLNKENVADRIEIIN